MGFASLAVLSWNDHTPSKPPIAPRFKQPSSAPFNQSGPFELLKSSFSESGSSLIKQETTAKKSKSLQYNWIPEAPKSETLCSPEIFISELDGMVTERVQERVVKMGIEVLFKDERTDCIKPLLTAMKGKKFTSQHLRNIAIQMTFVTAALERDEVWVKELYKDPAITSEIYAKALDLSGILDVQNSVFHWLLKHADYNDLKAVKEDEYAWTDIRFDDTISDALSNVDQGLTRIDPESA